MARRTVSVALTVLVLLVIAHTDEHEFMYGADMSELAVEDCYETCSPYRASYKTFNITEDALLMLKNNGYNTVRMRIWNNPNNDPSTSDGQYCNLTNVLYMARCVVF